MRGVNLLRESLKAGKAEEGSILLCGSRFVIRLRTLSWISILCAAMFVYDKSKIGPT
jgi:hypothetical protein